MPGPGLGHLRIFNSFQDCTLHLQNEYQNISIEPMNMYVNESVNVKKITKLYYKSTLECIGRNYTSMDSFFVEEGKSLSYWYKTIDGDSVGIVKYIDKNEKSKSGYPFVRFVQIFLIIFNFVLTIFTFILILCTFKLL